MYLQFWGDFYSPAEHKHQSPFTFIVWKKYAIKVNGYEGCQSLTPTYISQTGLKQHEIEYMTECWFLRSEFKILTDILTNITRIYQTKLPSCEFKSETD